MLAVGALGVIAGQPWLFPSLGPTAFLQAEYPELPASRWGRTVGGHLVGLGMGALGVWAFGVVGAPPALGPGSLVPGRIEAAAFAVAATIAVSLLLRVSHPPAASTTLLVALGSLRITVHDIGAVVIGLLVVASLGELFRRLRLRSARSSQDGGRAGTAPGAGRGDDTPEIGPARM
jgi:hypothetical protein